MRIGKALQGNSAGSEQDLCPERIEARRAKIRELLQMANIDSMDDIQDLFKETIAEFMENQKIL